MKTSLILRSLFILAVITGLRISAASAAPSPVNYGVSFQIFYSELAPYGDWVLDPQFGNVWVPFVDAGFKPYFSDGYWAMTEFGNTWVSDLAWGWATFHYGRWFWNSFYGWAWVPGYDWGPAWVSWRTGGGYYGWAPLPPGYSFQVGFYAPSTHWIFIPQERFLHPYFQRFCAPNYNLVGIFNRTTVINNTYIYNNQTFYTGPSRREVERVTNSRVPVYQVRESSLPGRTVVKQNELSVYRPDDSSAGNTQENSRLSRSFRPEEFKEKRQTRRSETESPTLSPQWQFETQRNAHPRNDNQDSHRDGFSTGEDRGTFGENGNTRYQKGPESAAQRPRLERGSFVGHGNPTRRQEHTPNFSEPLDSRQPQARPQNNGRYSQPRQQPQANPLRQQSQVEHRRGSESSPILYPNNQNGSRNQQSSATQRSTTGVERKATESRGSRRGID